MTTNLFMKAINAIENEDRVVSVLAAKYGCALHTIANKQWFVLRVANALIGVK